MKGSQLVVAVVALLTTIGLGAQADAGQGDCAQPLTSGPTPTATDCLYILQAAVGSVSCTPECICAPKGSLPIAATDALLCLASATGQTVPFACPCATTTTSTTATTTTTLFTPADCGEFATKIGTGKLSAPFGVAVDSNGNIYVADAGSSKIVKFGPAGAFVKSWGGKGSGDGKFFSEDPRGIAVGTGNRVYAGDTGNRRVQFFDSNGGFLGKWGSECFLSQGTGCVDPDGPGPLELGDGQFIEPYALATDADGNVYVVDSSNYRVQVFDGDGVFLRKWSLSVVSRAIAVADDGDVFVAGNDQIFRYDPAGNLLDTFGSFCRLSDGAGCVDADGGGPLELGDGQTFQGLGMIAGSDNGLFVVDDGNGRTQWLSAKGAFRAKWGSECVLSDLVGCVDPDGPGPLQLGDGQFGGASGVAVHTSGDVLVAEAYNARLQRFNCPDLR